jgi:NAD(P)-dependent dehydrogenase (short-subunit alcohol dehydrogenase family)
MTMPSVLITGANRGIGLELARQYAADGWRVFAAARNLTQADELKKLGKSHTDQVKILTVDVADAATLKNAASQVGDAPIDVLINCAGVYGGAQQRLGSMDYEAWLKVLDVNTLGPARVTETFLENVANSQRKLIVSITSGMGSLADNTSGGYIAYRTSKAALNMLTRSLAIDLASRGVTSIVINPGWVKTRMGGPQAKLTPAESVQAMRKVFADVGPAQSGKFFNYDGREYPW